MIAVHLEATPQRASGGILNLTLGIREAAGRVVVANQLERGDFDSIFLAQNLELRLASWKSDRREGESAP